MMEIWEKLGKWNSCSAGTEAGYAPAYLYRIGGV